MTTERKEYSFALLFAALGVLLASAAEAGAQGAGAVVPLPAEMRNAAERYLPGVVGEAVPAFPIDPGLAQLAAGTRRYQIISSSGGGTTEEHVITPVPGDETGRHWRYRVGDRTVFLQQVPGQSLDIVSEEDSGQGVLTRYHPPEPLLIAGMNAGDSKRLTMKVDVYDLSDPKDLEHKGSLDVTLTYVGAYRVTVPAGTYDAALLRWDFRGKGRPGQRRRCPGALRRTRCRHGGGGGKARRRRLSHLQRQHQSGQGPRRAGRMTAPHPVATTETGLHSSRYGSLLTNIKTTAMIRTASRDVQTGRRICLMESSNTLKKKNALIINIIRLDKHHDKTARSRSTFPIRA